MSKGDRLVRCRRGGRRPNVGREGPGSDPSALGGAFRAYAVRSRPGIVTDRDLEARGGARPTVRELTEERQDRLSERGRALATVPLCPHDQAIDGLRELPIVPAVRSIGGFQERPPCRVAHAPSIVSVDDGFDVLEHRDRSDEVRTELGLVVWFIVVVDTGDARSHLSGQILDVNGAGRMDEERHRRVCTTKLRRPRAQPVDPQGKSCRGAGDEIDRISRLDASSPEECVDLRAGVRCKQNRKWREGRTRIGRYGNRLRASGGPGTTRSAIGRVILPRIDPRFDPSEEGLERRRVAPRPLEQRTGAL